ncbi:MAG: mechanosensitive ion channel [Dysgonamonadaceae bacterium]|nr:mechanosensitive ion channel [Dysgonamonadaceae bacterium]MDD4245560.1 mechanosensitive ion channel [Dysgonamonadaceae bacterium]
MKEFFDYELFDIGGYKLQLDTLISFIIFITVVVAVIVILKRLIYRSKKLNTAEKFSINKLSRYVIVLLAFIIGLRILGFDITVLLAGYAAVLLGLGFGLQHIFNDFISGIILLLDGSLKVDDIVEVNERIYRVEEINFRTTTVLGRDENYVILPNSELTGNRVVNWTYNQKSSRFQVDIGVDYATDVLELMEILKTVAKANIRVLEKPEPFVRFENYAESSLDFAVYFYTFEIFRAENIKSEIRIEIFKALKAKGINIPFPQRVIRFKKDNEDKSL